LPVPTKIKRLWPSRDHCPFLPKSRGSLRLETTVRPFLPRLVSPINRQSSILTKFKRFASPIKRQSSILTKILRLSSPREHACDDQEQSSLTARFRSVRGRLTARVSSVRGRLNARVSSVIGRVTAPWPTPGLQGCIGRSVCMCSLICCIHNIHFVCYIKYIIKYDMILRNVIRCIIDSYLYFIICPQR
jgi:hypothetical protein